MRRIFPLFISSLLLLYVFSYDAVRAKESTQNRNEHLSPLVFIILPVENVSLMYEKFLPLKEYIGKETGRKIVLRVAKNYQEAIEAIGKGEAHLAYLDPSAYCEAKKAYGVFPIAKPILAGSSVYRSVIVARQDSAINKIVEVKGKDLPSEISPLPLHISYRQSCSRRSASALRISAAWTILSMRTG